MPEVHVEYIKRRYLSNWLSIPTLIACIIWVGALILPLYISWETRLWMKEVLRFEQPNVEYKNQLIVHLYGLKGAADAYREPFVASWTTSSHANDLLAMEGTLRSVIVRSSSRDLNYDGLTDRLRIEVTMPLDVDETITGYYLAAYANYNLYDSSRFQMDGAIVVNGNSPVPVSEVHVDGQLGLQQKEALVAPRGGIFSPYYETPLPSLEYASSPQIFSPEGIRNSLQSRNFTLRVDPHAGSPVWVPDFHKPRDPAATAPANLGPVAKERDFVLKLECEVPVSGIRVHPSISEELKHGWIQYASFLAITMPAAWILLWLVFGLGIVDTTVVVDSLRGGSKVHVA